MVDRRVGAIGLAILAAVLYAISIPAAKVLMGSVEPTVLAGILYLGAGIGMSILLIPQLFHRDRGAASRYEPFTRADLPYVIGMVGLDIAAPVLLMFGLQRTTAGTTSILNNLEIVFTALIALLVFKERVSKYLFIGIIFLVSAGIAVSFEGAGIQLNFGALLVTGATACWGLENNFTRQLSSKDTKKIVAIKGLGSGAGALIVGFAIGEQFPPAVYLGYGLLLGFMAYGMSISVYIKAQKHLGAATTSAFYSLNPFVSIGLAVGVLNEPMHPMFGLGLALMSIGMLFIIRDTVPSSTGGRDLAHEHRHSHEHRHGDIVHTHSHTHTHSHRLVLGSHLHWHADLHGFGVAQRRHRADDKSHHHDHELTGTELHL